MIHMYRCYMKTLKLQKHKLWNSQLILHRFIATSKNECNLDRLVRRIYVKLFHTHRHLLLLSAKDLEASPSHQIKAQGCQHSALWFWIVAARKIIVMDEWIIKKAMLLWSIVRFCSTYASQAADIGWAFL